MIPDVNRENAAIQGREQQYFRLALENTVNIIFILDSEECIVYASRRFLRVIGVENFDLICGRNYKTALAPYIYERALDSISDFVDEAMYLNKSIVKQESIDFLNIGTPRLYNINVAHLYGNEGRSIGLMAQLSDITDIKTAIDEANRANKAKSEFLANMSHEIRTPLNAVMGMSAVARGTRDIGKIYYCMEKIEESGAHLLGLINDILDMSKIEADRFELSYAEFNFGKMITRIADMMRFKLDEKKLNFEIRSDPSIPELLISDEQRLSQIIMNLLSNAVKFTDEGGSVELIIKLNSSENEINEIQFSIKDNGIGITEEQKARLFIPFSQADTSISRKFGGTGLGLAISKRIVELMGGSITAESEPGKGSEFIFTISAKTGGAKTQPGIDSQMTRSLDSADAQETSEKNGEPSGDDTAEDTDDAVDFTGKTVMLVEDVQLNREIIIALLEDTGITIISAENGEEAIKLFNSDPYKYDLIFMDIHMPVMDGYQASRRIRSLEMPNARTIPIVAMTANVFKDDVEKCILAGMNDHVGKPVDIDRVKEVIKKYAF